MSTLADKLRLVGYASLASSIGVTLWEKHKAKRDGVPDLLGNANPPARLGRAAPRSDKALAPYKASAPVGKLHNVANIDQRVQLIQRLSKKGAMSPRVHEHTSKILSQKCGGDWCVAEKDYYGEVKWIFNALRNPRSKYAVRYTRDMVFADTFTSAERTLLEKHAGDCDDYSITIAAMLMSIGHPVKIRVIATNEAGTNGGWSHVYLITQRDLENPNSEWIAIDCSVNKPLGWEAPGAKEVAATGRPHGMVTKVKDFSIT